MIIGFTCSSFDLLHAGHVLMLEECKKHCDYLIVGFNVSPVGKEPAQSVYERFLQIKAVKYVDEVIPYGSEEELLELLKSQDIDIRFIGEDYKGRPFTGHELPIKIFYNTRRHNFSTTALKKKLRRRNKV